jgi:cytochrome c oxidase subunit 4
MNPTPSTLPADPTHDREETIAEMRHHIRRYLIVGVALILGTLLTVWASLINFGSREINIVVALFIAAAKGSLVVAFFMHLISEKKMIYAVLIFTAFFFTSLMFLTLFSMHPESIIHIR